VFAVYTGRVVEVERSPDGVRGDVTIDHHPLGAGLVSRYLHLEGASICVEEGESVTKGDLIAQLGSGPADPHLHVELRIVLDPSDRRFWFDPNSVALDPTRLLYRVEGDYRDSVFFGPTGSPSAPASPDPSSGEVLRPGRAGGARAGWDVPLGVEGTAEPGRRRWRSGGLPSAGC